MPFPIEVERQPRHGAEPAPTPRTSVRRARRRTGSWTAGGGRDQRYLSRLGEDRGQGAA